MKREIKFRIWDDILKIMYTPEMDEKYKNLWEIPSIKGGILKVRDEVIIMQFTGLTDKNGIDIYEDDIVEYENNNCGYGRPRKEELSRGVVIWNNDWLTYDIGTSNNWDIDRESAEVIGNIYENPELI